jgi:hypothetical protein
MDDTPNDDSPAGGFVECDILVEGYDVPKRRASNDRDEVPADGKQDEDNIDVEDQSSRPGNSCEDFIQTLEYSRKL